MMGRQEACQTNACVFGVHVQSSTVQIRTAKRDEIVSQRLESFLFVLFRLYMLFNNIVNMKSMKNHIPATYTNKLITYRSYVHVMCVQIALTALWPVAWLAN